jgi:multiple sugar transport system ATP-binding protein
MARIDISRLSKQFGIEWVIPGLDLTIEDGEFMVFVGPSGCGKSTLLRMLAGLEHPTSGDIAFDGQSVVEIAPSERGTAMVFQSYALYPHMTVEENMAFGLRMSGVTKSERRALVAQTAETLQLTSLLDRYPKQLSGGQRQRVAIGRAIVRRPKVFLFDEPLSNLDAALRVQMRIEIARLHADLGTTMVYVTHDQTEAMTLGNRIAVFNKGVIEQVGPPMELYQSPANRFVAEFLGAPKINLLPYNLEHQDTAMLIGHQSMTLPIDIRPDLLARLHQGSCIGVRPEHLRFDDSAPGWFGQVDFLENLGDVQIAYLQCDGISEMVRVKLTHQEPSLKAGQTVRVCPDWSQVLILNSHGRSLIV